MSPAALHCRWPAIAPARLWKRLSQPQLAHRVSGARLPPPAFPYNPELRPRTPARRCVKVFSWFSFFRFFPGTKMIAVTGAVAGTVEAVAVLVRDRGLHAAKPHARQSRRTFCAIQLLVLLAAQHLLHKNISH